MESEQNNIKDEFERALEELSDEIPGGCVHEDVCNYPVCDVCDSTCEHHPLESQNAEMDCFLQILNRMGTPEWKREQDELRKEVRVGSMVANIVESCGEDAILYRTDDGHISVFVLME